MKHLGLLLALLVLPVFSVVSSANDVLVIQKKNQSIIQVELDSVPSLSFSSSQICVTSKSDSMFFAYDDVVDIHFSSVHREESFNPIVAPETEDDPDYIESPSVNKMTIKLSDARLMLNGCVPHSVVSIYSLDGKLLLSNRIDDSGCIVIDLTGYKGKVIIVRTEKSSFKLMMK